MEWFDKKRKKISDAFPGMTDKDLHDLLNSLRTIDGDYADFDDFIPGSDVRKIFEDK
ncbi:MAG: hypothetical protein WAZ10_00635 [Minisyncoccia bacterium]